MTKQQIARMRAACTKAKEVAGEIDSLADEIDSYEEQHDARETARNIKDEADVSLEWMRRIEEKA